AARASALSHGLRFPRAARGEWRGAGGTGILVARIPVGRRGNAPCHAAARHRRAQKAATPAARQEARRHAVGIRRAARGMTPAVRVTAYVGLGANLGEPRQQLEDALVAMGGLPHTRIAARSSFYRSAPVGYQAQPDFVNAVAALDTGLAPGVLLEGLQGIERRHGRERSFPDAPRTLDLDLLLYGEEQIARPGLTVPHPRMHERAFVLRPLAEIAPEALIPGRGRATEL